MQKPCRRKKTRSDQQSDQKPKAQGQSTHSSPMTWPEHQASFPCMDMLRWEQFLPHLGTGFLSVSLTHLHSITFSRMASSPALPSPSCFLHVLCPLMPKFGAPSS